MTSRGANDSTGAMVCYQFVAGSSQGGGWKWLKSITCGCGGRRYIVWQTDRQTDHESHVSALYRCLCNRVISAETDGRTAMRRAGSEIKRAVRHSVGQWASIGDRWQLTPSLTPRRIQDCRLWTEGSRASVYRPQMRTGSVVLHFPILRFQRPLRAYWCAPTYLFTYTCWSLPSERRV